MTPADLIAHFKPRVNPAYANILGSESYERRLCVEAIEDLIAEIDTLRTTLAESRAETDSVTHARDEAYRMMAEREREDAAP